MKEMLPALKGWQYSSGNAKGYVKVTKAVGTESDGACYIKDGPGGFLRGCCWWW